MAMASSQVWLKRIRNIIGFMGMILPWIALFGAYMVSKSVCIPSAFWDNLSISATYYITPALTGILTTAAVVLMCYDGYELKDDIVTTLSGVCGLMIVLFPCNCAVSPEKGNALSLSHFKRESVDRLVLLVRDTLAEESLEPRLVAFVQLVELRYIIEF